MQVTTNEKFVRRHVLISRWATLAGIVVLGIGMYISIHQAAPDPRNPNLTLLLSAPWVTLVVGIILLNLGKSSSIRWGGRPRPDEALAGALKGLDNRHYLYNYIRSLPVEHLLVAPYGLYVLETRGFIGSVINDGNRWRRKPGLGAALQFFAEGSLGNPSRDVEKGVTVIRSLLEERFGAETAQSWPIWPIIVFTNPRVELSITDPEIPVVQPKDLRSLIRRPTNAPKITQNQQRQFVDTLVAQ